MTRMVGRSEAFAAVMRQVALAAPFDVPVLLTGETGTGKSLLARLIHESGPRVDGPFVEFDCARVRHAGGTEELFGSAPDQPAIRREDGALAAAVGGTLVLDEVYRLTHSAQLAVVRFLESNQCGRSGLEHAARTNVRLIATTWWDLEESFSPSRFREDLRYVLSAVSIRVPGLAERTKDVPELAALFCDEICRRQGLPSLTLPPAGIRLLKSQRWYGNVRQLVNAIERAAIRAAADEVREIPLRYLEKAVFLSRLDEFDRQTDEIMRAARLAGP